MRTAELKSFVKRHLKRGFKFSLVGSMGALINLSVLFALTEYFNMWYLGSEIVAILVALFFNYFANTYWTYKDAMRTLEEARALRPQTQKS